MIGRRDVVQRREETGVLVRGRGDHREYRHHEGAHRSADGPDRHDPPLHGDLLSESSQPRKDAMEQIRFPVGHKPDLWSIHPRGNYNELSGHLPAVRREPRD